MKTLIYRLLPTRCLPRRVLCDLSPHLKRDMGLEPCPKDPRLLIHSLL
ncbi:hypothetical protein K3727_18855 [Rhodobacteraceae bacterium M382]|nr:hypothetical protein K3727_18855 [Rhodobacteraceae bacterium M382]